MRIGIKRLQIEDNPSNEVTTYKLFKNANVFDNDGNPVFHKDGIFSERIFGKFGRCKCGALTQPGICKHCGCRVLDKKSIPNFYTKFNTLDIPYYGIEINDKIVNKLLHYKGFLYDEKYFDFNLNELDISSFDVDKIKIGKDAILELGYTEEWFKNNTTNKIFIPHTSLRKIIVQGENYFLGELNTSLINILKLKYKLEKFDKLPNKDVISELVIKQELLEVINTFYDSLYELISRRKNSIIDREIKGQSISGAARAVVTNNFQLDEDTLLIGYYFIPTLYPHLFEKYIEEDGWIDVDSINKELEDYLILLNRQPTIGEKSMIALHPKFSPKEDERFVIQLNPLSMSGLAGDYDGDVLLMIALYTKEACQEAKKLLPSRNYIGGANGEIRNGIFEDLQYVMKKSYEDGTEKQISSLICGEL